MSVYFLICFFTASVLLFFAFYLFFFGQNLSMAGRIDAVLGSRSHVTPTARQEELSLPLFQRIIFMFRDSVSRLLRRPLPVKEHGAQQKLPGHGKAGAVNQGEFMALKVITAICGGGLLLVLAFWSHIGFLQALLLVAAGGALGWVWPDFQLKQKARQRKEDIQNSLPDVMDLLTISVQAGVGFDGAMAKVVEKGKGVVAAEFYQVLQEIAMGKPRKDALRDMANRVGLDDMSTFVGAIVMADQLGLSIGNTLRLQSEQMRRKRRQRAEEQAMKAPIKMLIPLVFFIFPTIFVVLLGPAVLQIMKAFAK